MKNYSVYTKDLPSLNMFAPEHGWLEYSTCFLLGPGLVSVASCKFQGVYIEQGHLNLESLFSNQDCMGLCHHYFLPCCHCGILKREVVVLKKPVSLDMMKWILFSWSHYNPLYKNPVFFH